MSYSYPISNIRSINNKACSVAKVYHTNFTKWISPSIGPRLRALDDLWRYREQPDVTCHVEYYQSESVTFIWELVRRNGDVIILPSHMEPTVGHWLNAATHISALNYVMSTEDFLGILRCIMQVDDKTHGVYKAQDEERIPCCGMCFDPVLG